MPLITATDLENAKRDADDLGLVVGGSATRVNTPQIAGTVTTRTGVVVKTLAKTVADVGTVGTSLLTPVVYNTTAARNSGLAAAVLGQLCYDRETTIIYQAVKQGTAPKEWVPLLQVDQINVATFDEVYSRTSTQGRISTYDAELLRMTDLLTRPNAHIIDYIRWPGGSTTLEGLALGLNMSTWPTNRYGQEFVDYSYRIDVGELAAKETHPNWTPETNRIRILAGSNPVVSGYNLTGGHIDQVNSLDAPMYVRDCLIAAGGGKLYCIGQTDSAHPIYVEHCEMSDFVSEAMNLQYGIVRNCNIYNSIADGIKINTGPVILDGNYIHFLGQTEPTTHADCIQSLNLDGGTIIRNTLYMPGTGSTYDEGSFGTTQCVRLVTESSAYVIKDVLVAGNLMFGGGYTFDLDCRYAGALVENVMLVNNIFGGPDYYVFGTITASHYASNVEGTMRNVLIHGNFTEHDGQPIKYAGVDQTGIWHYSKEHMNHRFLEVGKRLGYLDWNGDLASGVTSRTS